jgi:hypothetical protein
VKVKKLELRMSRVKKRIEVLIRRLENGDDIQNRDLKAVLTKQEFEVYEGDWEQSQDYFHGKMFDRCSRYEELLAKGDFFYNRAESGRFKNSKELHDSAQSFYEKALEALSEEIGMNSVFSASYDRSVDDASLNQAGMPRHRSSKSISNEAKSNERLDKRQFKLKHLKSSLEDFERRGNESVEIDSDSDYLKNLLAKLKNRK